MNASPFDISCCGEFSFIQTSEQRKRPFLAKAVMIAPLNIGQLCKSNSLKTDHMRFATTLDIRAIDESCYLSALYNHEPLDIGVVSKAGLSLKTP